MWTVEHSSLGRIVIPPHLPPGFAALYTTVDYDGRIVPDALETLVRERFGLEITLTTCVQTHGAVARRVTPEDAARECDSCDALWSGDKGIALGIKVADCLPVTMIDPAHSIIADVHSGWRGAVQHIADSTLDALERETAFDPRIALAYLGPSIRVCCFEVGEDVAGRFDRRFVDRRPPKPHVDLVGYTIDVLEARGFSAVHIFDSGLCTLCEGSIFHSYRREGSGSGRNLAIVAQ